MTVLRAAKPPFFAVVQACISMPGSTDWVHHLLRIQFCVPNSNNVPCRNFWMSWRVWIPLPLMKWISKTAAVWSAPSR